ncbi:unnamed protein product [Chrysoparadoxa australica]
MRRLFSRWGCREGKRIAVFSKPTAHVAEAPHTQLRWGSNAKRKGMGRESKKSVHAEHGSRLALALKQVEVAYGKGSIMQLGKAGPLQQVDVISTGSLSLDLALGTGGLPRGRIVEIFGAEASGKTTVALHTIAQCQAAGGTAVFIDAEHALDPAYAGRLGVNIDDLYLSQPDSGEQALDIVEMLVKSGGVDVIVVDSVAALVPRAELEGDMGDHHIALQARLMSQALRKLTAVISKTGCLIIFINQVRQKVGVVFGNPEVTAGGTALRFYCSVRLEVRKGQQIKRDGAPVGNACKIKVAKNKLASPFKVAEVDMIYGAGLDRMGEVIDLGVAQGLLSKSGAWYGLTDEMDLLLDGTEGLDELQEKKPVLLGQGRDKARSFLFEHPALAAVIEDAICAKLEGQTGAQSQEYSEAEPGTTEDDDGVTAAV